MKPKILGEPKVEDGLVDLSRSCRVVKGKGGTVCSKLFKPALLSRGPLKMF